MCKWRSDRRSGNYNLSNCKINPKKFWDFNGIRTHGLCVSAAVQQQQQQHFIHISITGFVKLIE